MNVRREELLHGQDLVRAALQASLSRRGAAKRLAHASGVSEGRISLARRGLSPVPRELARVLGFQLAYIKVEARAYEWPIGR